MRRCNVEIFLFGPLEKDLCDNASGPRRLFCDRLVESFDDEFNTIIIL